VNEKYGRLSEDHHLMKVLRSFQAITGLAGELRDIESVRYGTLRDSEGRLLEGTVRGNTMLLTKLDARALMRTLLVHEVIDKIVTRHVIEPNQAVINGLIKIIEDLLYRSKEVPVEGLTKLFQPEAMEKLQSLFKEEEMREMKSMVKVLRARYYKEDNVTIADIKNADKKFRSFKPLRILTAKRLRRGDMIPLNQLNVVPWTDVYKVPRVRERKLARMRVPVAKRASYDLGIGTFGGRMISEITNDLKRGLINGIDVAISYPGAIRGITGPLPMTDEEFEKLLEKIKGGILIKEEADES